MKAKKIGSGLDCSFAGNGSAEPLKGKSSSPFIYSIDYGDNHIGNPVFLKGVADNSSCLMHVAHDTPFIGSLGANSAYTDNVPGRLLTPEEASQRIKTITAYVDSIHKTGVKVFISYICPQTLMGDPENRKGFWEFYDHWDDYAKFGFGAKPKDDPIDWNQRTLNGGFHFNYPVDSTGWPSTHRYCPCLNNPNFQSYLINVVRLIAQCGYDGIFVDNCEPDQHLCYCRHCQKKFIEYMKERYALSEIKELFKVNDYFQIKLAGRVYVPPVRLDFIEPVLKDTTKSAAVELLDDVDGKRDINGAVCQGKTKDDATRILPINIDWSVKAKASLALEYRCFTGENTNSFLEHPVGGEFIRWQSEVVPGNRKGNKVTFIMAAGMGSNFGDGRYELFLNGRKILEIDTSYETTINWKSELAAGQFETVYIDGHADIFGIFSVTVNPEAIKYGKRQNFEMKGKSGSPRGWFMISEIAGNLNKLNIKELQSKAEISRQIAKIKVLPSLLSWESQRFRAVCMQEAFLRIRKIGEEITRKDFFVIINRGGNAFAEMVMRAVDWKMLEDNVRGVIKPSSRKVEVASGGMIKEYNDYILDYKYTHAAAKNNNGKIALFASGDRGPNLLELGLAEAAAFGEGGVFVDELISDGEKLAVKRMYSSFFGKHWELYDGLSVYADIGVVVFNQNTTLNIAEAIALKESNIPFDFITQHNFNDIRLRAYKLIVLPNISYMSDKEMKILFNYMENGGKAIIVGETGAYDEKWRKRTDNPLILNTRNNQFAVKQYGKGNLFYAPSFASASFLSVFTKVSGFSLSVNPDMENNGVRMNVLFKEGKLVVHLVNYNVAPDDRVTLVKDIPVSVRLPCSWEQKGIKVSLHIPGKEGKEILQFNVRNNAINFIVPYLTIYCLIEIEGCEK